MTHSRAPLTVSLAALVLAFAAGACNDEPTHDLGYTSSDLTEETPPPALPPVAEYETDFDGVWIGEADDPLALLAGADDDPPAYRFPSGSTRIRLEVASSGNTITFGEAEPLPPATDADVGYPPDPDFGAADTGREATDCSIRPPFEGFPYPARAVVTLRDLGPTRPGLEAEAEYLNEGRLFDGKLDLSYALTRVFESWCALQTAESCTSPGGISAIDSTNECFAVSGDERMPINCQKAALCASAVCDCPEDGSACGITVVNQTAKLSIRFSDDGLVGLFSGAVFVNERGFQQPLGTVHFRREPAADAGAP